MTIEYLQANHTFKMQMFWEVNLTIVLFVFGTISQIKADNEALFLKLIQLQVHHCKDVSFCTFSSQGSGSESHLSCCKKCSCDEGCVENGTCCPDFQLRGLIGERVSNSISDLSDRLTAVNISLGMKLQDLISVPRDTQEHMPCVDAKITTNNRMRDTQQRQYSYRMIITCPETFLGNPDTTGKCTNRTFQGKSAYEPDLYIPVTSLKTKKSYKNIYCFWCNEENQTSVDLSHWKVIQFCTLGPFRELDYNPYNIFRTNSDSRMNICNVAFKPGPDVESVVNRCDPVDVKTCTDNLDKNLVEVCEAFHLPVVAKAPQYSFKWYKNIACYLCNIKETFEPYCTSIFYHDEPYFVDLNLQLDENNTIVRYNESEQHVLDISMQEEDGPCKTGFIWNSEKDICERVLCPKLFYPMDASCHPTYKQMENLYFTALLEVRRTQNLDRGNLEDARRSYIEKVSAIAANVFQEFTVGLWQLENVHDIFAVSFITLTNQYTEILTTFSDFLTQIGIFRIKTRSTLVHTVTALSKVQDIFLYNGTLSKGKMNIKPTREYRSLGKPLIEMSISSANLCYRTEVDDELEEAKFRERLYPSDVDFVDNVGGKIIVCIDEVYQNLRYLNSSYMFAGYVPMLKKEFKLKQAFKRKQTINDNADIDSDTDEMNEIENDEVSVASKDLFAVVATVGVVGILVVLKFIKYRRENTARIASSNLSVSVD